MVRYIVVVAIAALSALVGCKPEFEDRTSSLERLRVLAVRSDPPEAQPGTDVRLSALVADEQGAFGDKPIDWAFCTKPRPLDEPNAVSIKCFAREADWILPLGVAPSVTGTLPNNACRQFGSDVPEPKEGEPPGRPADPDPTGGYYQPTRLLVDDGVVKALGQTRLVCGLPGATREIAEKYRRLYHLNTNPAIASMNVVNGAAADKIDPKTPVTVPRGGKITFRVTWPECPDSTRCGDGICGGDEDITSCKEDCTTFLGCGGAEKYLQYDLASLELLNRRESMRVSWFSNAGTFDQDRTGRDENETASFADNVWTAPSTPGNYPVIVVLRDARGGVDWSGFTVVVQ
jgi:hypothetical protein